MPELPRFHLAVPVDDLAAAESFYGGALRCPAGRRSDRWIDWDLHGHQLVTHLVDGHPGAGDTNAVDGHDVPVPHFGLLLDVESFHAAAERLRAGGVAFVIDPHLRFSGEPGEQWTLFVRDPAGNAIELKAFADDADVFRA